MTTTSMSCPRSFEAEAARDGRLVGAALASFVRHRTTCAVCDREAQALQSLAESLRASRGHGQDAAVDELLHLRQRTRLIAAFDETLLNPAKQRRGGRPLLLVAAAVLLVAGAALLARARHTSSGDAPSMVSVRAGEAAEWSRSTEGHSGEGARERLALTRGELWVRVDHARGVVRLAVDLPDGRLEDIGTTFTVRADGHRTTQVAVQEGRVMLHLRGQAAIALGAGDTWTAAPPRTAEPAPVVAVPAAALPAPAASPPAARAVPRRAESTPPSGLDTGADFRAAVTLLDQGADRDAAAAFERFLTTYPGDSRAEDAAYLRIIALQRCGAQDERRAAARAYLRAYPAGFRRPEVEGLSR